MKPRIVAIDDESHVLETYKKNFFNFMTLPYQNVEEAISYLKLMNENHEPPSAVIIDYHFENYPKNGEEIADQISLFYEGPIFIISGILDRDERIRVRENYCVIAKGQDLDDLIDCIEDRIVTQLNKKLGSSVIYSIGDYSLNSDMSIVTPSKQIVLTRSEYVVFRALMASPGIYIGKDHLDGLLRDDNMIEKKSHQPRKIIQTIKKKVEDSGIFITNAYGKGWKLTIIEE